MELSRAYMAESFAARDYNAQPPWEEAVLMWRWVRNQRAEKSLDRFERQADRQRQLEERKEKTADGSRKRRRNPASR